jgi:GTP pyrophosphokinase
VIGPYGERIEIQMRTSEMHRIAEEGIAAHWRYKEGGKGDDKADQKIMWLRHMLEWQKEVEDSKEYIDLVKVDLFPDDVYVFTPNGEVLSFPKGATPVDFAYRIHTEVGHQCAGAKVNGQIVPLDYEMKSGDRIEIITQKDHLPNRDWLKMVKTGTAKAKIRQWLKKQQHDQSFAAGKTLAEKELRRYKLSYSKAEKEGYLESAAKSLGFKNVDNLIAALGYGKLSMTLFLQEVVPKEMQDESLRPKESALDKILRPISKRQRGGIKIKNIDNVLFRLARCCSPLPGEKVVGFVTRGRGITVHAVDCIELELLDDERMVDVEWDLPGKTNMQQAQINLEVNNRTGMLADTSQAIAAQKVNIAKVVSQPLKNGVVSLNFTVEVEDITQLKDVMKKLKKLKGVQAVHRVRRSFTG